MKIRLKVKSLFKTVAYTEKMVVEREWGFKNSDPVRTTASALFDGGHVSVRVGGKRPLIGDSVLEVPNSKSKYVGVADQLTRRNSIVDEGNGVMKAMALLKNEFNGENGFGINISDSPEMAISRPSEYEIFTNIIMGLLFLDNEIMAKKISQESKYLTSLLSINRDMLVNILNLVQAHLEDGKGYAHFFLSDVTLKEILPFDVDCTSMALMLILRADKSLKESDYSRVKKPDTDMFVDMAEKIINNVVVSQYQEVQQKDSSDEKELVTVNVDGKDVENEGVIQVYFPKQDKFGGIQFHTWGKRLNRVCPVVAVNALSFLYLMNQDLRAEKTKNYLVTFIKDKDLLTNYQSKYYKDPVFLFHAFSRLFAVSKEFRERRVIVDSDFIETVDIEIPTKASFEISMTMEDLVAYHIKKYVEEIKSGERPTNSLNLSALVISMRALKIDEDVEAFRETIVGSQKENGGWGIDSFFQTGQGKSAPIQYFGSLPLGIVAALAATDFGRNFTTAQDIRSLTQKDENDFPFQVNTKSFDYKVHLSDELDKWLGVYKLFEPAQKKKMLLVVSTYVQNCSPGISCTSSEKAISDLKADMILAGKFLLLFFKINDLPTHYSGRPKKLNEIIEEAKTFLSAICTKKSSLKDLPLNRALRTFRTELEEVSRVRKTNSLFFESFKATIQTMVTENEYIKSGELFKTLDEYDDFRKINICVRTYIDLWKALGYFNHLTAEWAHGDFKDVIGLVERAVYLENDSDDSRDNPPHIKWPASLEIRETGQDEQENSRKRSYSMSSNESPNESTLQEKKLSPSKPTYPRQLRKAYGLGRTQSIHVTIENKMETLTTLKNRLTSLSSLISIREQSDHLGDESHVQNRYGSKAADIEKSGLEMIGFLKGLVFGNRQTMMELSKQKVRYKIVQEELETGLSTLVVKSQNSNAELKKQRSKT